MDDLVAYRTEALTRDLIAEVAPLVDAHIAEASHIPGEVVTPPWDECLAMDAAGRLIVATARLGTDLVGYSAVFACGSVGMELGLFVRQDLRRRGIGAELVCFSDGASADHGLRMVRRFSNMSPNHERALKDEGYMMLDTIYGKVL